jgi:peptide deformylase
MNVVKLSDIDEINTRKNIPLLVKESDPILTRSCKPFDFNGSIAPGELADKLFGAMEYYRGVGLSACQIGIDARVFVMGFGQGTSGVKFEIFNPKVMSIMGKDIVQYEGCLSFPLVEIAIKRPGAIMVSFQDRSGKYHEEMFSGLTARIFLHEYDHMEGITFKNRASKLKWDLAIKHKNKLKTRILRSKK